MLWVDKYRPRTLIDLSYNSDVSQLLKKLSQNKDCPHLLLYGPSGAGKKTCVIAFLRELFGSGVEKIRVENRTFTVPNSTISTSIHILMSSYHIEVTPSDVGNKDRIVIQQLIKEIAQSPPIPSENAPSYKVVVINEAQNLSKEAQAGLRRTMEKYVKNCRLILLTDSLSKILPPVRSRCLCIRVSAPSVEEITHILHTVAKKEGFDLPNFFAMKIAQECQRDPRRALLMLETAKMHSYPFRDNQTIPIPPWEDAIRKIAERASREQSPKALGELRNNLYDVLALGIPGGIILKELYSSFSSLLPTELWHSLVEACAYFDATMRMGTKEIFHLEAFLARVMSTQREWIIHSN